MNALSNDIELLYPAQFGNNLVLTPHTYLLNAATVFTDTLYLNAENNANAVFVIKINGLFSTSTYSKVKLINGTQAKNVFWKIEGAVGINNYSVFKGTIICHNGALGALNTGVVIDGRALTTNGALSTTAMTTIASTLPLNCATVGIDDHSTASSDTHIFPNPFTNSFTVTMNGISGNAANTLIMYNYLGEQVLSISIIEKITVMNLNLPAGVYFYKITENNNLVQSGKLISQQ